MKPKTAVLLLLSTSVFFACLIVLSDILLEGSRYNKIVMYSLIALWWVPFSCLTVAFKRPSQSAVNSTNESRQ